jgi:phosphoglycolate phosphatase
MTTVRQPPRALLFDWDNTLADNWVTVSAALNAAFDAFGLPRWSVAETKAQVRESMRDRFPKMFGADWERARDIFYETFRASHLDSLRPMPGAGEMLAALAGQGLYLGVVSNKNGDLLRREADHLGWTRYFGRLVGATDAAHDKPAPDPVHLALKGSGIPAGEAVWFVGDAPIDMECARAAGCVAVLVGDTREATGEISSEAVSAPPDFHVADCAALVGLVANPMDAHITS